MRWEDYGPPPAPPWDEQALTDTWEALAMLGFGDDRAIEVICLARAAHWTPDRLRHESRRPPPPAHDGRPNMTTLTDRDKARLLEEVGEMSRRADDLDRQRTRLIADRNAKAARLADAGIGWQAIADQCGLTRQAIFKAVTNLRAAES